MAGTPSEQVADKGWFPCRQCGAGLEYAPGTTELQCPYCGAENPIEDSTAPPRERDFVTDLRRLGQTAETIDRVTIRCEGCGAESELEANRTAGACPFCGNALVAARRSSKLIKPQYLLPFHVTQADAAAKFRRWLGGLWFAPSDLKATAQRCGIHGIYIPAWTYDFETETRYVGQRGDDYWTTETFNTFSGGRRVTATRQVKRTRWTNVSGTVYNSFDDLLVLASTSLPHKLLEHLEPWDLKSLTGYRDEFVAGFAAESYQIDLPQGFEAARKLADDGIRHSIIRQIGGDQQRIDHYDPKYHDITYKHILLPVWLSSYRYRGRVFRFLINARTGEVRGQRPYSVAKITLTILAVVAAALLAVVLLRNVGGP